MWKFATTTFKSLHHFNGALLVAMVFSQMKMGKEKNETRREGRLRGTKVNCKCKITSYQRVRFSSLFLHMSESKTEQE